MTGPVAVVDILGPAHGGTSVARVDGQVVFVRGALPGEKGVPIRVDDTKGGKRFLTATVTDAQAIEDPSPHRVSAVCPAAAAGAGCCDLDFVDQEGSLSLKRQVVIEQFQRIGGIDLNALPDGKILEHVSPSPFTGYRTRVRLGVDVDGRAGLRRRSSSGVVPLAGPSAQCAQWAPGLAKGLAAELSAHSLTPGTEVCVALGDDGARSIVEVPPVPRPHRRRQRGRAQHRRDTVRRRILSGMGEVVRTVGGRSWRVPTEAFWQAHRGAAEMYSEWVAAHTPVESELAWDLYGGAGVFAAALGNAVPGIAVDCVDIASPATAAGRDTLADRDVRFVTGDVAGCIDTLRGSAPGAAPPSAVVVDPPRTGAGQKVTESIVGRGPAVVLYIGCDPATAARDAAVFTGHGYHPDAATVVDAFGLTHHVEVLVRYVR